MFFQSDGSHRSLSLELRAQEIKPNLICQLRVPLVKRAQ